MSLERGTHLGNNKIISSTPDENISSNNVMAESNVANSDTNDHSDISSQLTEMKENYEKEINDLHSEFSQLKDLMMAIISKSNEDSPSTSSRGLPKRPQSGFDMVTGVTEIHSPAVINNHIKCQTISR